jgi:hypothetical protein
MKKFPPDDLRQFLEAVDRHLRVPVSITVIGGSAAAIHGVDTATKDIDTWDGGTDLPALQDAAALARVETGLDIPIGPAGVPDAPWDFERRRVRVLSRLQRLSVLVMEAHDLALSKLVRGVEGDMQHIRQLHAVRPLDFEVLLTRFLDEMSHVIKRAGEVDVNFYNCVDMLFGEVAAIRARRRVERRRSTR